MKKYFTLILTLLVSTFVVMAEMNIFVYKKDGTRDKYVASDVDSIGFVDMLDANGHEWVNLGLPSGILWATCNVGANSPEDYGDYFAWGETEPKEEYDWSTYKWCEGSKYTQTKYCVDSNYGIVDNKTILDLSDDAANANWGGNWRMPTNEEQEELQNTSYTTWTWTTLNGVYGYKVTSKINGNSIFLPAAGYCGRAGLYTSGSPGDYWSSSLRTSTSAYYLYFVRSTMVGYDSRFYGRSVRPVLSKEIKQ